MIASSLLSMLARRSSIDPPPDDALAEGPLALAAAAAATFGMAGGPERGGELAAAEGAGAPPAAAFLAAASLFFLMISANPPPLGAAPPPSMLASWACTPAGAPPPAGRAPPAGGAPPTVPAPKGADLSTVSTFFSCLPAWIAASRSPRPPAAAAVISGTNDPAGHQKIQEATSTPNRRARRRPATSTQQPQSIPSNPDNRTHAEPSRERLSSGNGSDAPKGSSRAHLAWPRRPRVWPRAATAAWRRAPGAACSSWACPMWSRPCSGCSNTTVCPNARWSVRGRISARKTSGGPAHLARVGLVLEPARRQSCCAHSGAAVG